jgi:PAS domain S-box-containing protein
LPLDKSKTAAELAGAKAKALRANFRKIERQEWWLWVAAFVITLLLTVALASFLLPGLHIRLDSYSESVLPEAIRGLVGLVFLFDLYTIYQHVLIHRIRRELVQREELFHLISENAADMIAVVDMQRKRLFNSLSYQKILGYTPEELQASSAFEQIHPEDRERVKTAADEAKRSGVGKTLEYRLRHKNGNWLVLESTSSVIRDSGGEPEKLVIVNRERYNGSGYPRGLKGEEILLSARIFAIADTLDAITSERPYQQASSFESSRETIWRLSGTHFDPQVVSVFLSIPEPGGPRSPIA